MATPSRKSSTGTTAAKRKPAARKPGAKAKAPTAKQATPANRTAHSAGVASLGAIAVAVLGAAAFGAWRLLRRPAEGTVPVDLMGDSHPDGSERAPEAFRPDPTAPVPASERAQFRPALATAGPGAESL